MPDHARELARRKLWATGLVVLAALVYVAGKALERRMPPIAYVAAFAEAAVIGGLADWYAVVALFRRPLGLPLPHTAVIPANQQRIADELGSFIAEHLLGGSRVGDRLREVDLAGAAGLWLARRETQRMVGEQASMYLRPGIAFVLDDVAHRLQRDERLRERLNDWISERAGELVERHKRELGAFIADEIRSWNPDDAVRVIEQAIGRDLQAIRINGALVGGALGLAIHTLTQAVLP